MWWVLEKEAYILAMDKIYKCSHPTLRVWRCLTKERLVWDRQSWVHKQLAIHKESSPGHLRPATQGSRLWSAGLASEHSPRNTWSHVPRVPGRTCHASYWFHYGRREGSFWRGPVSQGSEHTLGGWIRTCASLGRQHAPSGQEERRQGLSFPRHLILRWSSNTTWQQLFTYVRK